MTHTPLAPAAIPLNAPSAPDRTHTLLICDADMLREATPTEVLDHATELVAARFRRGTQVLANSELTRQ